MTFSREVEVAGAQGELAEADLPLEHEALLVAVMGVGGVDGTWRDAHQDRAPSAG